MEEVQKFSKIGENQKQFGELTESIEENLSSYSAVLEARTENLVEFLVGFDKLFHAGNDILMLN